MRLVTALLVPSMTFFSLSRPFAGLFCLLLQISLVGWIPASAWAVAALSHSDAERRIHRAVMRTS